MTGEERDKRLVLAASRGSYVACVHPDRTLEQAARAFGYLPRTLEGDAFETAFDWAHENLAGDREQKARSADA